MVKSITEEITAGRGIKVLVDKREIDNQIELSLRIKSETKCLLHWGLLQKISSPWQIPPPSLWPEGSKAFGQSAVQTPFKSQNRECRTIIKLDKSADFSFFDFALYFPDTGDWDNNHGQNYHIELLTAERTSPVRIPENLITDKKLVYERRHNLKPDGVLATAVVRDGDNYEVVLVTDKQGPVALHWGISEHLHSEWLLPGDFKYPAGTVIVNKSAAETPFSLDRGLNQLILRFEKEGVPPGISFVLKQTAVDRWIKDRGQDFFMPITSQETKSPEKSQIARKIIKAEMGNHSWTLMHRFNLCYDLMNSVRKDVNGLALLFVWLRFSAIRQLDWQRRYNTKPRELSHAQDRLTLKLSEQYIHGREEREFIRLMMASLGRGGEGQKIRDEILNIMHRHRIKEVSGHFMEEWHQKLHNNTTPDDIIICDAYLEFLRNDGDIKVYYKTLREGGVTKKRLESFDRPIVTEPDFIPHLKEPLIHDFENFLKILKSIHSGTDLESAVNAAKDLIDDELNHHLDYISKGKEEREILITEFVRRITSARRILSKRLDTEPNNGKVRDMLYLDLALEEFMRVVIERSIHEKLDGHQLVELIGLVLENSRFFYDNEEFSECSRDWKHLENIYDFTQDWALHAKAVLDRLSRGIGSFVDRYYQLLQSKAEYLGKAFHADQWTISLFTEEVVRGRPAFVLSMLIRHLDPALRKKAKLGDWQIISPGRASGQLEVVDTLRSIQGKSYDKPSIIIAEKVRGDEEPPEGVTAVITPDPVDLVSHIAVRARNSHILFATCHDSGCYKRLKTLRGHVLKLNVNAAGDVVFEEAGGEAITKPPEREIEVIRRIEPEFTSYAVASKDFSTRVVGGKSHNLKLLQDSLPAWIHLPASVALPFGVFEKILTFEKNRETAGKYHKLLRHIAESPRERLAEIRETLLSLEAPDELVLILRECMEDAGLGWHPGWDSIWMCIKHVWASKWNERAYLSRKARGIPHEDIFMAVLVQHVIEAEYAFVIHTLNPFTKDRNELYGEVVLGLGETLVGNYPGRALSFVSKKDTSETNLLGYPSKSMGLFGRGLIFRSDSNAEDLPGYSGAGLYDSVMLEPPVEVTLRYTDDPLLWNEDFKQQILSSITEIGITLEKIFGTPQDIEGAFYKGEYYVVQSRPQVGI